jgi:hypothetical protein
LSALAAERWGDAQINAGAAGYRVCRTHQVAVMVPARELSQHARIAVRLGPATPVVFEAPHPFHDEGTAEQARVLFEATEARALLMSGTHRCTNAGDPSGHVGVTGACGDRAPYATSDMAHTTESAFHAAHKTLFRVHEAATFVSLHGMAQEGVSISNGTRRPVAKEGSPVPALVNAFRETFEDARVSTCNAFPGAYADYRLCGTTNLQGRHVNGYGGVSVAEPTHASGRFVHVEQSRDIRENMRATVAVFRRWLERGSAREG